MDDAAAAAAASDEEDAEEGSSELDLDDEGAEEGDGASGSDVEFELEGEEEDAKEGSLELGSSGDDEDAEVVGSRGGEAGPSGRGGEGATAFKRQDRKRKQAADPESMQSLKKQLEDARKKRLKLAEDGGGTDQAAGVSDAGGTAPPAVSSCRIRTTCHLFPCSPLFSSSTFACQGCFNDKSIAPSPPLLTCFHTLCTKACG